MPRPGEQVDAEAKEIAANLRRIRLERGITQVELAQKLGVTQQIVSDYERAQLRLHGQILRRLTEILSVTSDQILGLNQKDASTAPALRSFAKRLPKIETLSKRDQQALLKTIDAFLSKAS